MLTHQQKPGGKAPSVENTIASQLQAGLLCICVLFFVMQPGNVSHAKDKTREASLVTVPASTLAVVEATVTVSVLQEPLEPMTSLLRLCQSDMVKKEGDESDEFGEQVQSLCRTVDGLMRTIDRPVHELQPGNYRVTVPLTEPRGHILAVTWNSTSLDEAISFIDLLQNGKLKALTVYTYDPRTAHASTACSECPIKDLVFLAKSIKEQQGLLRKGSGR